MAVIGLVLTAAALPARAYTPYPGVHEPDHPGSWYGVQGNGLSEVARAREWVRLSAQALIVSAASLEPTYYPADDPEHRQFTQPMLTEVTFSSPARAKHGYGEGIPITVRTAAFGTIPVEAQVQIEQLRDAQDVPVPLLLSTSETDYRQRIEIRPGVFDAQHEDASHLRGQVKVRVNRIAVDGIDLHLAAGCTTGAVDLVARAQGFWANDPENVPEKQDPPLVPGTAAAATWMAKRGLFSLANGGSLSGTVTIPPFSGCRTRTGEDVSRLLTAAISGPGNRVTVGAGTVNGNKCTSWFPGTQLATGRAPYSGDPSDCDPDYGPPQLDYPIEAE
ncbi:hypothetical protein AB3X52_12535 [Nocardioides sp. DS6]|uniref:Uncharacterized protein n=1 Tax=Nocardioides eburneus TaxID=3231482 RepID=A0ABV3SZV0_9ACTN